MLKEYLNGVIMASKEGPNMEKIQLSTQTICYPMPCSLVGVNVGGKPNYLTVAWFSMVNFKPPYFMIALGKSHYTNPGIKETGTFSVNIPSAAMADVTDYCGLVSGKKYDKAKMFETFYGKLKTAPMIKECPFNVECKVIQTVDLPVDEIFIGECIAAYSDERYLTNGVPDMRKIAPFILSMPERKYLALGAEVGPAWEMGKKLIPKGT
jgi:flavin reductase (DIM6/NTAB) family NADH-FMN oxidoreductase RutF